MQTQFHLCLWATLICLGNFTSCFGQFEPLDCINAIELCSLTFIQTNKYDGVGSIIDEIGDESTCLWDKDERSIIWYTFTTSGAGELAFLIRPADLNADYDWALFDMTNASCEDLKENANALLVSCNAAGSGFGDYTCNGITGMTTEGMYDIQGGGCHIEMPGINGANNPINASLALAGEHRFVLAIQDWDFLDMEDTEPYTIDFSASSPELSFDKGLDIVDIKTSSTICSTEPIKLTFNRSIPCGNLNNLEVQLIDQDGQIYIGQTLSAPCSRGETRLVHEVAIIADFRGAIGGTYQFIIDDTAINRSALTSDCGSRMQLPFETTVNLIPDNSLDVNIRNRTPRNDVCAGEEVILRAEEIFDFLGLNNLYTWTLPDGSTFVGRDLVVISAGVYTVDVLQNGASSQAGCRRGTATYTIDGGIDLDLGSDKILCLGDSLSIAAQEGGIHYIWNTGETSANITVTESGIYSLTVTTDCGDISDEIDVTFTDIPALINGATNFETHICQGETISLQGSEGQMYQWDNGATDPTITVSAGEYTLTVTDADGCTGTATANILIAPEPIISFLSEPMCAADNQSYSLDVHTEAGNTLTSQVGIVIGSEGIFNIQAIPVEANVLLNITNEFGCTVEFAIDSDAPPCACPPADLPRLQFISAECKNNGTTYTIRINTHPDDVLRTSAGILAGSFGFLTIYNIPIEEEAIVTLTNALGCSITQAFEAPIPTINLTRSPTCSDDIQTYSLEIRTEVGNTLSSPVGRVIAGEAGVFTIEDISVEVYDFVVRVSNSGGCEASVHISGPDCACPQYPSPQSTGDQEICTGDVIPTLSVTTQGLANGLEVHWYDKAVGGTRLAAGLNFSPTQAGTYYAEVYDPISACTSARTAITLTIIECNSPNINSANSAATTEIQQLVAQPNPFHTITTLQFKQANAAWVELVVYDIAGKILVQQTRYEAAGLCTYHIRADQLGTRGIYFYRIQNATQSAVGKLILH